jgi:hypothetical protein
MGKGLYFTFDTGNKTQARADKSNAAGHGIFLDLFIPVSLSCPRSYRGSDNEHQQHKPAAVRYNNKP